MVSTFFFLLPFILVYTILAVWAERKISAFMQDRLGPMEVGYYGLLQTVADLLKLLQKEDIVPTGASKWLFKVAPLLVFAAVFMGFSVVPLGPHWPGAGLSTGVFFLLAIVSLDVIGIVLAGWASANKYSTLGAFRSAAQIVSYEVPLGLTVLAVVVYSQSMDLQQISNQQGILSTEPIYFLGIKGLDVSHIGGFLSWNIFQMPVLFLVWVIFFIATLSESNRAPFDLPEAESELVAGYQTEYSGFRWAVIMLAEYAMMLLVSLLGAILFFGGWNSALPDIGSWQLATWTTGSVWGIVWLTSKGLFFVAVQIWVRWTYPRVRIDQLMNLSWKYLTPVSLVLVIIIGFWKLWLL
ncbi:MAG: complex I subunit 1/NuoH family protein [Bacteroidota bacterium]